MHFIRNIRWVLSLLIVMVMSIGAYWITTEHAYAKGKHGHGKTNQTTVSQPLSASEEQQARTLYSKTCVACHGQRLEGVVGPSLVGVGSRYPLTKIEQIAQGGKGKNKPVSMPAGLATPEEARLLARWLAAGPKLPADAPASIKPK